MKSIAVVLVSITLLSIAAAPSSSAAEQENLSIDNATRTRIVTAAVAGAAKRGGEWQAADVGVQPASIPRLDRNGCIFMVAINNTHVKDGILLHYALLPDGRIAGADITGNAAATVLRVCSQQADANWWAYVIACLSGDAAGAMPVINRVPDTFDELVNEGLDVKAPTLTRSEGATTVEFFAFGPGDLERPLHIRATLPDQGELTVIVNKLVPW